MGGDSGVECRGDCAVEHGRRRRERTWAREYRGGGAEEVENGVLCCGNPTSFPTIAHFCRMKRRSPTRILRASQRDPSLCALTQNKTPLSTSSAPPPPYSLAQVRSRRLLPCSTAQSPRHSTPLSPPIQSP